MDLQQQLLVSSMLLLFLWPLNPCPLVRAQSTVMPGCSDRCGDVIIPCPFGTTSGCYLSDAFRIDFPDNSTTALLSLGNSTNLEVTGISVEYGTIEVKFPIVSDCDEDDSKSSVPINFEGSSFSFSPTFNSFTATGCNNLALLTDTNSTVAGCTSICNGKYPSARQGTCSGINSCQTTIPSAVQVFEVDIYPIDYPESNCSKRCVAWWNGSVCTLLC